MDKFKMKQLQLLYLASAALTVTLSARDQIKMVGSSTVYPFCIMLLLKN